MGYSTGIQYGTAVINKVNKPPITNLNENTWKLIKLVISSFFNVCSESNRTENSPVPARAIESGCHNIRPQPPWRRTSGCARRRPRMTSRRWWPMACCPRDPPHSWQQDLPAVAPQGFATRVARRSRRPMVGRGGTAPLQTHAVPTHRRHATAGREEVHGSDTPPATHPCAPIHAPDLVWCTTVGFNARVARSVFTKYVGV